VHCPLHAALLSAKDDPNLPALHGEHSAAPDKLNCPGTHTAAVALVDPLTHACPALQFPLHAAEDRPACAPNSPAAHAAVHAAVDKPVVFPKRPAAQSMQALAPDRL
jgi:hypothetical protein